MTSEKNRFLVELLMPVLLSAQFAPAAFAGDLPSLQKQEAAVDTQTAAEDAPAATPILKGAVEKGTRSVQHFLRMPEHCRRNRPALPIEPPGVKRL